MQEADCRPAIVLRKLWDNFDKAIAAGDTRAAHYKSALRVLAAGGDGTVAWILGTIRQVLPARALLTKPFKITQFLDCLLCPTLPTS